MHRKMSLLSRFALIFTRALKTGLLTHHCVISRLRSLHLAACIEILLL